MGVGLYRMNVHVIRHATPGLCPGHPGGGGRGRRPGDRRVLRLPNNSDVFAREAACVMAANGNPRAPVRVPAPHPRAVLRGPGVPAASPASTSPPATTPRSTTAIRSTGRDGAQLPPCHADQVAKKMKELDVFACVKTMDYDQAVSRGLITLMGARPTRSSWPTSWSRSTTKRRWRRRPTPSRWCTPPSTAPATSSSPRPCAAWG